MTAMDQMRSSLLAQKVGLQKHNVEQIALRTKLGLGWHWMSMILQGPRVPEDLYWPTPLRGNITTTGTLG